MTAVLMAPIGLIKPRDRVNTAAESYFIEASTKFFFDFFDLDEYRPAGGTFICAGIGPVRRAMGAHLTVTATSAPPQLRRIAIHDRVAPPRVDAWSSVNVNGRAGLRFDGRHLKQISNISKARNDDGFFQCKHTRCALTFKWAADLHLAILIDRIFQFNPRAETIIMAAIFKLACRR